MSQPFIVTALFEADAQEEFQRVRDMWFPPERNIVPAHLTLFHALPAEHRSQIEADLSRVTTISPLEARTTELRSLGRGVAIMIASPGLLHVRANLAERWQEWLTPQDRQKFAPHVVIQNKVAAEAARETIAWLQPQFAPEQTHITALRLWTYLNGPWRLENEFPFRAIEADAPASANASFLPLP